MLENELQPVLRAMRRENSNIVAIHQHMSSEQPSGLGQRQSRKFGPGVEASFGCSGAVKS
jgi:Domain of Unknown Function (DUF1259)